LRFAIREGGRTVGAGVVALGVILVNGWTDAPNAVATCVSTRSLGANSAILMAAVFNFLGVLIMTIFNATVAQTIFKMVDFGSNPRVALVSLCAALCAIVLWATAAWWFGIPTSESHALIAGISGAAIALQGGYSAINPTEWIKVLYGLLLSSFLGFGLGWLMGRCVRIFCIELDRRKTHSVFKKCADCCRCRDGLYAWCAGWPEVHGCIYAWDYFCQKGRSANTEFVIPIWLMVLCSLIMALGTSIGGLRIIKTVGMDMVKLETYQGFSADLAAVVCLFTSSLLGIPVSTTHTKTSAIMGVGAEKRLSSVNWGIVKEMIFAWVLTFPGCGLIGFLMASMFIRIL
jgi:inorganic phosphate transporter, PiT family